MACDSPDARTPSLPSFPRTPIEHAMYDVTWAKALDLADMRFTEIERQELQDVRILAASYHAFDQIFSASDGSLVTLPWRQRALLCLPLGDEGMRHDKAMMMSYTDNSLDITAADDSTLSSAGQACVEVARGFRIPILLHGWEPDLVRALDGKSLHDTQARWLTELLAFAAEMDDPRDLPLDGRWLFNSSPLVRGDLVSGTLLQRWVERETGTLPPSLAALGFSKAGGSLWTVTMVDERFEVVAPGGYYSQDTSALLNAYREDWNCRLPPDRGAAEWELAEPLWRFLDWSQNSDAGRQLDRSNTVAPNQHLIRARHLLISGDLGIRGHHDWLFPLLTENVFLSQLDHPSWRYVRALDGGGLNWAPGGEIRKSIPLHVADLLVNGVTTPSTPRVTATELGRRVRIEAQSDIESDLETEALLVWIVSPDRHLHERAWRTNPMKPVPGAWGRFSLELPVDVPENRGLTFMVLVRQRVELPDGVWFWRSAASLPQERFALPRYDCVMPNWR